MSIARAHIDLYPETTNIARLLAYTIYHDIYFIQ